MTIRNILLATMLAGVGAFSGMAFAQDVGGAVTGGAGGRAERAQRLSFLSAEDRQHLMRVRRQAMEGDPQLKSEQESLKQEWQALKAKGSGATAEDKEALVKSLRAQNEHLDAAMLKIDPTIQPILDQIKAHRQERFQQGGAGAGGGNSANP
jgi:hypothetical protein